MLIGMPWRGALPDPDGTIGAPDRLMLLYLYSGIAANTLGDILMATMGMAPGGVFTSSAGPGGVLTGGMAPGGTLTSDTKGGG